MMQNYNKICEYFYWDDKRNKFYCSCFSKFMYLNDICPVYICVSCSRRISCHLSPCDELCRDINELDIDI